MPRRKLPVLFLSKGLKTKIEELEKDKRLNRKVRIDCDFLVLICLCTSILEETGHEEQNIVKNIKRKHKANPNVQSTSKNVKVDKGSDGGNSSASSDEGDFRVNYKSKKSAMSAGPSDQGATAVVVK